MSILEIGWGEVGKDAESTSNSVSLTLDAILDKR
jgi:hypothetical protein